MVVKLGFVAELAGGAHHHCEPALALPLLYKRKAPLTRCGALWTSLNLQFFSFSVDSAESYFLRHSASALASSFFLF